MAGKFPERKYTPEQCEAIYAAKFERGISYPRIAELAGEGELIAGEPFAIGQEYVGKLCRSERKRRLGKAPSPLADMSAVDSVEHLRKRLASILWQEANAIERQPEGKRDLARLEAAARGLKILAGVPGPRDPRPEKAPGSHTHGEPREPAAPARGPVGELLAEHRRTLVQNGGSPPGGGLPGTTEQTG